MLKALNKYAFNRFSQNGEDGIIEEICSRLGLIHGWFVEFGAWDGKHLSNTFNLLQQHGWQGVHIEGSPARYQELQVTAAQFPGKLHTICAMISEAGENRLDQLLQSTPLPRDFDLLSIDIDSIDWQIWNSLSDYRPKIVVIESNGTLPPGIRQLHSPPEFIGASFSSLVELGEKKGYHLVCYTGNCIFVSKECVARLDLDPGVLKSPEKLFNWNKHFREKLIDRGRKILPESVMRQLFNASNRWKQFRSKR